MPGLIIDSASHAGTTYTTAFFSVADETNKNAADVRFNFQPALAIQGDHLIMSSSDALARDLIDALQKQSAESTKPVAGKHSLAMLKSAPLASILNANRDAMVRQNMVEDGKSREDAEKEVDGILTVLNYLNDVQFEAGQQNGQRAVDAQGRLPAPVGDSVPNVRHRVGVRCQPAFHEAKPMTAKRQSPSASQRTTSRGGRWSSDGR